MHKQTPAVRNGILEAAATTLLRDGVEAFTISRVAQEAGLSVGGLRYHFASKQDLLEALVDHAVVGFDEALDGADHEPGAKTRAYIAAALPGHDSGQIAAALVAAVAVDSSMLAILRRHFARWQSMLDADGIDPVTATLIRLTMDGWWLAAFADLAQPDDRTGSLLRARLEALVEEATNA
ncbi:TetR/AcrR family transcriptional regulator [Gordonia liuliyuniae]|uniref:TetR/AcrR family transcriptional regulator n=1 Tax=Gordonia liuliyuniae TaxID=2911517 RepID=A0ABS9IWU1_9ACTN|nr:TetR/AcrR family transcriptional regulator [Gordonia liuliyuniae]MCF8590040.1 TetR/AcrR family transcriptional regulator [Gordonia liuliyuniae]